MSNRLEFQAAAEKIVRDLFAGSRHAPRVRAKRKQEQKKARVKVTPIEVKPKNPPLHLSKIPCPCCSKPAGVPDIEVIIDYYDVPPLEEAVLRAIWKGKGYPVMSERIFDAMYADDPDGGPTPTKMYAAFKVVLSHLRKRILGSGITIENAGYRRGYRLVIGEK